MTYLKRLVEPLHSLLYTDSGKRGVYVNEETPFFKFEYPAGSVKYRAFNILLNVVMSMKTSSDQLFSASVMDVTENMTLADIGPEYYLEGLKNSGKASNIKIISNKPIILKDGTEAYRTELEFVYATGAYNSGVVIVSAFKDKKLVVLVTYATAGLQSDVAWIPESLTFK